ncbi:viroplasmin family protein [Crassaminicella indica]|uniref:ribonuclease H n=1 Tax=Crassaminicella indica TaxID=2855394 RepID=A0ABX8RF77_9CLOT|nr:ribonuclease H family protein [Crassaminicella indica]QXM07112.1 ribonuclease H family protein [Crassaminicella indica]
MGKNKFYAVRKGRQTGIFMTWAECEKAVKGYSGAEYKSFLKLEDAELYIENKVENNVYRTIEQLKDFEMIAYVDGSYDPKINYYSYGVITFFRSEKKSFSGKEKIEKLLEMRNVAGEIQGARVAMDYALQKKAKKLYLYYDYEGIEKWATSAWEAKKEGTKEYKKYYDEVSKNLEVIFVKVKAHSGDKYNEEVDKLAKKALYEQE